MFVVRGKRRLLVDTATGATRRVPRASTDKDIVWQPDGKAAILVEPPSDRSPVRSSALVRFDMKGGRTLARVRGGAVVAWSPDGRRLTIADRPRGTGRIRTVDVQGHALTRSLTLPGTRRVSELLWTPNGKQLLVLGTDYSTMSAGLITPGRPAVRRLPSLGQSMGGASWSPDGRLLGLRSDGALRLVRVRDWKVLPTPLVGETVDDFAVGAGGARGGRERSPRPGISLSHRRRHTPGVLGPQPLERSRVAHVPVVAGREPSAGMGQSGTVLDRFPVRASSSAAHEAGLQADLVAGRPDDRDGRRRQRQHPDLERDRRTSPDGVPRARSRGFSGGLDPVRA